MTHVKIILSVKHSIFCSPNAMIQALLGRDLGFQRAGRNFLSFQKLLSPKVLSWSRNCCKCRWVLQIQELSSSALFSFSSLPVPPKLFCCFDLLSCEHSRLNTLRVSSCAVILKNRTSNLLAWFNRHQSHLCRTAIKPASEKAAYLFLSLLQTSKDLKRKPTILITKYELVIALRSVCKPLVFCVPHCPSLRCLTSCLSVVSTF